MSREYQHRLRDIHSNCQFILKFTTGLTKDALFQDDKTYYAVMYCLQTIGEAARQVPSEVREKYPQIEWRQIIDARNLIVHEYFGLDEDAIWSIITEEVPELLQQITQILDKD